MFFGCRPRPQQDNQQAMAEQRSKYQQKIISGFYKNRGALGLQRLSELVTDLYLAEGKKREQVWGQLEAAMKNAGVKDDRIKHLRAKNDPQLVAKLVEELMAKQ
jgi:hypothetical protein